ncbi:MAG TPA: 23S rRNA (adenine(2030)-N(6))-methyltransferase RlmJ [Steroidobacteraceae bacterium]|nr:23S rRNA (adenine(2030)-N(6))-methyltransferase RlmJ [Steroidobacteraceae bacterium]
MKYRHGFHAGNFADVHKHVALLALLTALKRKDKGFLYLDTHAGRGSYELSAASTEAATGVGRLTQARHESEELRAYAARLAQLRSAAARPHLYPGSPLLAVSELRRQDRAVLIELQGGEAHHLENALRVVAATHGEGPRVRIERGDGFAALRASLPPPERRGLTLLDPPYEETRDDHTQVASALAQGLRRFPTGVFVAWYPIKDERDSSAWRAACAGALHAAVLSSELWLYPRDSRVALNGSGLLIVNPPWRTLERMQVWLPELEACLAVGSGAGSRAQMLSQSAA